MNIALVGYGKMGKAIEVIAKKRNHTIKTICNSKHPIETADFSDVDVAIEFSTPEQAIKHIRFLADKNIPIVVGTTGWNDQLESISEAVEKKKGALLYASNFSVGVNLFFKLNNYLAKLMNNHPHYYASMQEVHHTEKLDAPSGTAITLAEGIIQGHEAISNWSCPQHPTQNEFNGGIEIEAIRKSGVFGIHQINYSSPIDEIQIKHKANNRDGFAEGAVIAAEWLQKKEGVYTMDDVLNFNSL